MFKKWFKRKPFVKITIDEANVGFSTNITDIRAIWGLLHVTEEQLKKMNPKLADFIAEQKVAECEKCSGEECVCNDEIKEDNN